MFVFVNLHILIRKWLEGLGREPRLISPSICLSARLSFSLSLSHSLSPSPLYLWRSLREYHADMLISWVCCFVHSSRQKSVIEIQWHDLSSSHILKSWWHDSPVREEVSGCVSPLLMRKALATVLPEVIDLESWLGEISSFVFPNEARWLIGVHYMTLYICMIYIYIYIYIYTHTYMYVPATA